MSEENHSPPQKDMVERYLKHGMGVVAFLVLIGMFWQTEERQANYRERQYELEKQRLVTEQQRALNDDARVRAHEMVAKSFEQNVAVMIRLTDAIEESNKVTNQQIAVGLELIRIIVKPSIDKHDPCDPIDPDIIGSELLREFSKD